MGTPLVLGDRVLVQTTTTGTGTYQLGAALQGFLTLAQAGIPSGSRVPYTVVDSLTSPEFFEVGEGIFTAGSPGTLTRGQVLRVAGGGNAAVNWPPGTRYLLIGPSALRLVLLDTDGKIPVPQLPAPLMTQLFMPAVNYVPHNTTTLLQWGETGINTLGVSGVYGFTLGETGIYDIDLNVSFPTSNGVGVRAISLLVGGTDRSSPFQSGSLPRNDLMARFRAPLLAGTFIQASALQDSGATQTVGGNARTHFSIVRIG
jgi:hypothetical protein